MLNTGAFAGTITVSILSVAEVTTLTQQQQLNRWTTTKSVGNKKKEDREGSCIVYRHGESYKKELKLPN